MRETVIVKLIKTIASVVKVVLIVFRYGVPKVKISTNVKRKCFILGNGPSLKKDIQNEIDFLTEEDILMVNHSSQTELFRRLKPRYFLLADSAFWSGKVDDNLQKMVDKTLLGLLSVNWSMKVFIPFKARKSEFVKKLCASKIEVCFFHNEAVSGADWFTFWAYKKGLGIPSGVNVLIPSLIRMMLEGYKEIYLLGADHDFVQNLSVQNDNLLYMVDTHYYEDASLKLLTNTDYVEVLLCTAKALISYEIIKRFSRKNGILVKNASSRSMIQSFEREKINAE
jgi:hypothetical protein